MSSFIHKVQWYGHGFIDALAVGLDNLLDFVAEGIIKVIGE